MFLMHKNDNVILYSGAKPSDGVPDMTAISEIDEYGINENLRVRYRQDKIYVSLSHSGWWLYDIMNVHRLTLVQSWWP